MIVATGNALTRLLDLMFKKKPNFASRSGEFQVDVPPGVQTVTITTEITERGVSIRDSGTVNLATGEFKSHSTDNKSTAVTPVTFEEVVAQQKHNQEVADALKEDATVKVNAEPTWDTLYPNPEDRITTATILSSQFIVVDYTNHRGSRSLRQIRPILIFAGHSEFHPKDSIFLHCIDDQTGLERDFSFAMHAVHPWNEELFNIITQFNEYSKKGYKWFPKPLMDRLNALLYMLDNDTIELPSVREVVSLNATIQSILSDTVITKESDPAFKEGVKASIVAILSTCVGQGIAYSQIPLVISIVGHMVGKINKCDIKYDDLSTDELIDALKAYLKSK